MPHRSRKIHAGASSAQSTQSKKPVPPPKPCFSSRVLEKIADSPELLEVARSAIEEELVELRDARIGIILRGNGLVIREKDGTDSTIIRMGPETAVEIGLRAIAKYLSTRMGPLEALEASENLNTGRT